LAMFFVGHVGTVVRAIEGHGDDPSVVTTAVRWGVDPNRVVNDTPLVCKAAAYNKPKLVGELVSVGANPNVVDSDGCTPLCIAVKNNFPLVVDKLLEKQKNDYVAYIDQQLADGTTALHVAVEKGLADVVLALLRRKANVDLAKVDGTTALMLAAEKGWARIVDFLCFHNAKTDVKRVDGTSALYLAALHGNEAIVGKLLKQKASVDFAIDGDALTSVIMATQRGAEGVVVKLLANISTGHVIGGSASAAVAMAAFKGHGSIVNKLLAMGADPNAPDASGKSARQRAADEGHDTIVLAIDTFNHVLQQQKAQQAAHETAIAADSLCL